MKLFFLVFFVFRFLETFFCFFRFCSKGHWFLGFGGKVIVFVWFSICVQRLFGLLVLGESCVYFVLVEFSCMGNFSAICEFRHMCKFTNMCVSLVARVSVVACVR